MASTFLTRHFTTLKLRNFIKTNKVLSYVGQICKTNFLLNLEKLTEASQIKRCMKSASSTPSFVLPKMNILNPPHHTVSTLYQILSLHLDILLSAVVI